MSPPRKPEGKEHEEDKERPFQIPTPDYLLDAVTTGGYRIAESSEEVVIVADRLSLGQQKKHTIRPYVYRIGKSAGMNRG